MEDLIPDVGMRSFMKLRDLAQSGRDRPLGARPMADYGALGRLITLPITGNTQRSSRPRSTHAGEEEVT